MKKLLLKNCLGKAVIGSLSYPIYILLFGLVGYLTDLIFGRHFRFLVVATYCKTGLPNGYNDARLSSSIVLLIFRWFLLLGSFYYLKRLRTTIWGERMLLLLVCFGCIDLMGLVTFFINSFTGTNFFKYFVSTIYLYVPFQRLAYFDLVTVLNILMLATLSMFLKPKKDRMKFALFVMIYALISVILLMISSYLFKVLIR
ncbi:hypothetical protein [Pedobacter helvus]|uniref:Uncharacterized protein n=1 Tax=Pedobacter helvus TaxID=2563444 RepID=A0ABW9JDU6_9SPHI|nr:hypothetical protein [Pedobacter ureilyticus]